MDGAKIVTDTVDNFVIDRRPAWAEVCSKEYMDRVGMKILAIVRT